MRESALLLEIETKEILENLSRLFRTSCFLIKDGILIFGVSMGGSSRPA